MSMKKELRLAVLKTVSKSLFQINKIHQNCLVDNQLPAYLHK